MENVPPAPNIFQTKSDPQTPPPSQQEETTTVTPPQDKKPINPVFILFIIAALAIIISAIVSYKLLIQGLGQTLPPGGPLTVNPQLTTSISSVSPTTQTTGSGNTQLDQNIEDIDRDLSALDSEMESIDQGLNDSSLDLTTL